MRISVQRRTPLRLAPVPTEATQHRPVCAACGGVWPCAEQRATEALARQKRLLEFACWACGQHAKSATSFCVLVQGHGVVLSHWCGPAKHRRCHETGLFYAEADRRARTLSLAPDTPTPPNDQ